MVQGCPEGIVVWIWALWELEVLECKKEFTWLFELRFPNHLAYLGYAIRGEEKL